MWRCLRALAFLALLLTACAIEPPPASTAHPIDAPTPIPANTPSAGAKVVYVHLLASGDDQGKVSAGNPARVTLLSWPVIYSTDGHANSMAIWPPPNVSEMQTCVSLDTPCTLSGRWVPFTPASSAAYTGAAEQQINQQVDWVGPRTLYVAAQYRDASGTIIPAVIEDGKNPTDVAQVSTQVSGVWDKATPIAALPSSVQTAVAATQVAFPVSGAVTLEGGRCCIGGMAGTTVTATASFTATSPFGAVQQMRLHAGPSCADASAITPAPWEPLVLSRAFPLQVAINFTSFAVSAQYRDVQGNLSPVYCSTLSVEGSPPATP
jgi:hypothetical protein